MDCPHKGPTMQNISLALIEQCNAFKTRHSSLLIIYDDIYIMLNGCNSACQHRLCIVVISLHARPGIYIHQQFYCLFNSVWANIPQNIKAPHYWSFVKGVNGARRIPRTQGQQGAKRNIYKTLQQIWTKYSLDLTAVKYSTILDTAHLGETKILSPLCFHKRHSTPLWGTHGASFWVLWRKFTARYRECPV